MSTYTLKDESKPRVLPPEGTYPGVCVDFVLRGFENTNFGVKDRCQFVFETPHRNPEYGDNLTVSSRPFNITFGKEASLRKFLEQWRGRKYQDSVAKEGVDAEKCIGLPCLFTISHNEKDGKTYANIESIMPLPDGMQAPQPSGGYQRVKDREGGWDVRSPNTKAKETASADPYEAAAQVHSGDGGPSDYGDNFAASGDDLPF